MVPPPISSKTPAPPTADDGPVPWIAALLVVVLAAAGCAGRTPETSWGARLPDGATLGEAALRAARSPGTWVPLAGAAVLSVGDLDEDISDWAADQTPLFGADAESTSDDLRTAAKAAWLVTALAAPSDHLTDKAGGLTVGVSTLLLEDLVTGAIKDASGRVRPDGSDDQSFSSGHAGTASAAATLARRNLGYLDLPGWFDTTARVGLYGVAVGTGWARVEARKHYVTDVLAGYAVGNFLATFMHEAFMKPAAVPLEIGYRPLDGGGAITVVLRHF